MDVPQYKSVNFEFLKDRYTDIYRLASESEKLLGESHIATSCITSRKFLEKIIEFLYVTFNLPFENLSLFDKIGNPEFQGHLENPKKIVPIMHELRLIGNNAAHSQIEEVTFEDALKALNKVFNLAVWFCKFNNPQFKYYEPFRDPTCLYVKNESKSSVDSKKAALAKLMAFNTRQFIDKKTPQNVKTINTSPVAHVDTDSISNYSNEWGHEDQLSIEEVFEQYSLTEGQNNLVKELKTFLEKRGTNVFLLKGYAGTGKTFITKGIVEYLNAVRRSVVLLAPTGKAAKVLSEKAHHLAGTLHNCIYKSEIIRNHRIDDIPETEVHKIFFSLKHNDLSTDTVYIVDEASMISDFSVEQETLKFGSGKLLSDFFEFVNMDHNEHNKKIIFIGDPAQLPPVSRDKNSESPALSESYLKNHFRVTVSSFTLTEVVRQKNGSSVLAEATAIRKAISKKDFSTLKFKFNNTDFFKIKANEFIDAYASLCNGEISKDIIAIAYKNDEVYKLNNRIRHFLFNKQKNFNEDFDEIIPIKEKDLLLITKNNCYDGVLIKNGEIVEVHELIGEPEIFHTKIKNNDLTDNSIPLVFQDAVLKVKAAEGSFLHRCKLFLTSIYQHKYFKDQKISVKDRERLINQAMIVHFNKNHPDISVRKDPEIYKRELENDPYFNALRVLYGYAITCHKSQGSEWKDVFVFFSSNRAQHNEDFFRWTYTAITRTSKNLYVINPPSLEVLSTLKFI